MGAPKNCAEAIAGMCRAVSALVILGLVALAHGNQSKDAAPEVLLSQLPEEGFSYQDTGDVTSQDNYVASLQGQVGLNAKLKAAHHNEAQERRKADGIEGGIQMPDDPTSDNFGEMELVQDWTPSGQPGLAEVLRKKHQGSTSASSRRMASRAKMCSHLPAWPRTSRARKTPQLSISSSFKTGHHRGRDSGSPRRPRLASRRRQNSRARTQMPPNQFTMTKRTSSAW